ncbi:RNA degradosome polyphosphate kinase [Nitratifractor salsuginis]|uniref:Polyphosphate kinase n=1 Tax=Nitratifractor salsuginis (strain DSM 16511 / JCM 12458 / E9I37-1) TaxID=749222 RepID=E6X378_NITSE|nr:RNA degradosome polyphosphate kinase [Nitratifractor salsuginis]ADV47291.1 Polyphosphate kinase [Nitratifractor salsuginis DSM 16511]
MSLDLKDPSLYINRELSWLQFNTRVLAQTRKSQLPPLERLKFIAIYGTNLDEFYMVRVAGLISLYKAGIQETGPDRLTPAEQLQAIRDYLHREKQELEERYTTITAELEEEGVHIRPFDALDAATREKMREAFYEEIYPVIIPIAIDATHPFPHLNNLSFALAVKLQDREGNLKHGLVRIPRLLPRFLKADHTFVPIESVVEHFIGDLFPGYTEVASTPFRVTRNADLAIEEEEADDFLEMMEEGLRSRNKGQIIRLELTGDADPDLVEFLNSHLRVEEGDIYYYRSIPLNLGALWQIVGDKSLAHLLLPGYTPKTLPPFDREEVFSAIEAQDSILYHPYESFEPVVKFIQQAAADPDTLAIRMTLYRVGAKSPIVKALIDAALDGKQVTVLVELKARFDEENNLRWAKKLEEAGAHVVYGIPGLKVHAKIAQVIKRKNGQLKSYLHLATGNYNPGTAKIYTDISYFTARKEFNNDATRFFHFLTGFSAYAKLQTLYMSPNQIKPKLLKLIEKEAEYGSEGHMILKANSLAHPEIIRALYKASQKGCRIELIIRGICCLRPGVEGVSENITVSSIIGKYLEHPRIYWFKHDEVGCYISSADLMPRNLDRRIELMTPIIEPALAERIEQILTLQLADNQLRWVLRSDGDYVEVHPKEGERPVNSQELLEKYVNKLYERTRKHNNSKGNNYVKRLAEKLLKES